MIDELPLHVEHLTIVDSRDRPIVEDVSFSVQRGATLGIVGRSGSGKTTLALGLLAHARRGARIQHGRVAVCGKDILSMSRRQVRATRSHEIAYVPQDARAALTPTMRVRALLHEAVRGVPGDAKQERLESALQRVELEAVEDVLARFPHQLSGGQLQRVAIAMAVVQEPRVLVLDEPTSSLDWETRDSLLETIDRLRDTAGMAVVLVSHDLEAIRRHAGEVAYMDVGRFVSVGAPELSGSQHQSQSRKQSSPVPENGCSLREPVSSGPLLSVRDLAATYPGRLRAVLDGVSFSVAQGECVALIGPSGCGKTTIARCIAGLHTHYSGSISLQDSVGAHVLPASARARSVEDRRRIQIVFQNPYGSLNPAHRVGYSIERALKSLGDSQSERHHGTTVGSLLEQVGLPAAYARLYPRQLSGGERQRVAIARALAPRPELLICDEVTSALDVTTQDTILDLLESLRAEVNLALLLITHDLAVARRLADRIIPIAANR